MSKEIKDNLINWFAKNTSIEEKAIKDNLYLNYFNEAWIDSIQFISFISVIEETYNISFENDEFQDRKFLTIEGLAEIIEKKTNETRSL